MRRLKRDDALALMDSIECGEVVHTLDAELAITGSDKHYEPARLPQPTWARPGSLEKIEVLRQRVARGEHLWHERDDRSPGEPRDRMPTYVAGIRELSPMVEVA